MSHVCTNCGHVDLHQREREVYALAQRAGAIEGITSRAIADRLGVSIANASNYLRKLYALGLLDEGGWTACPGGGIECTYFATKKSA